MQYYVCNQAYIIYCRTDTIWVVVEWSEALSLNKMGLNSRITSSSRSGYERQDVIATVLDSSLEKLHSYIENTIVSHGKYLSITSAPHSCDFGTDMAYIHCQIEMAMMGGADDNGLDRIMSSIQDTIGEAKDVTQ